MNNIKEFKKQLIGLIEKGNLKETLNNLGGKILPDSRNKDEVIIFTSKLNILNREIRLGLKSTENINLDRTQLINSILELIRELQEEDFMSLDDKLIERVINLKGKTEFEKTGQFEKFNRKSTWKKIRKIGYWSLEQENAIGGEGMFTYLLSQYNYGQRDFSIFVNLNLYFKPITKSSNRTIGTGIILGWLHTEKNTRYFNILFTGKEILFEAIGSYGGGDIYDFIHLSERFPCEIIPNVTTDLKITVQGEIILVVYNNQKYFKFNKPKNMIGRIGIRPWRAKVLINHFEVNNY